MAFVGLKVSDTFRGKRKKFQSLPGKPWPVNKPYQLEGLLNMVLGQNRAHLIWSIKGTLFGGRSETQECRSKT